MVGKGFPTHGGIPHPRVNMKEILWQLDRFNTGIHTEPGKVTEPVGEYYANELLNLRVDDNGWLRTRQRIFASGASGADITGVAATDERLYVLRTDGLFVRDRDDLDTEYEVGLGAVGQSIVDLSGRISVVNRGNYDVVCSEGLDQGYLIDTQTRLAEGLGIRTPAPSESLTFTTSRTDDGDLTPGFYAYRFTWAAPGHTLGELESNPSEPFTVEIEDFEVSLDHNTITVTLPGLNPVDPPITHYRIYRTDMFEDRTLLTVDGRDDLKALTYRLVATWPLDESEYEDIIGQELWATGKELEFDNDVLPSDAKAITEYGGRIWAVAGDRLVYSDLKFGIPRYWAFPKLNEIRVDGSLLTFACEFRSNLLFGGRTGTWRLVGTSAADFDPDQISSVGAIDAYACVTSVEGVVFVSTAGLYITDGSTVQKISQPLNDIWKGKKTLRGAASFLPDNEILFSVRLENRIGASGHTDYQFKWEGTHWTRWDLPFDQIAGPIEEAADVAFFVANGRRVLYQLDWNEDYLGVGRLRIEIPDDHIIAFSDREDQQFDIGQFVRQSDPPQTLFQIQEDPDTPDIESLKLSSGAGTPASMVTADVDSAGNTDLQLHIDTTEFDMDRIAGAQITSGLEETLSWSYRSNQISGLELGVSNLKKIFKELRLNLESTSPVTLTFWTDEWRPVTKVIEEFDVGLEYVVEALDVRGRWLIFTLAGDGEITLKGVEVKIRVQSRKR